MRSPWAYGALLASTSVLSVAAQDTSVFTKVSNDTLLWGPYKSNLYFGIRPRLPRSVSAGLMWSRAEDYQGLQTNFRHTCEQHEGMDGYGWDLYDPRTGGVQTIHDKGNGLDLETSFVKFDNGKGGWGARIKGTPRSDAQPSSYGSINGIKTSVWFSLGVDGLGALEPQDSDEAELGYKGDIIFDGQTNDLGDFKITISESKGNKHPAQTHPIYEDKPLDHTFVQSFQIPEDAAWQAKALAFQSMKQTIDKIVEDYTEDKYPPPWQAYVLNNAPGPGNVHILQKVFEGPFEFDVVFHPASAEKPVTSDELTQAIKDVTDSFGEKYPKVLKPQAPFTDKKYLGFSKALFSNLIGGIGYFHGDQVIDRSYATEYEEENEGFWSEAEEARSRNAQKLEGPYELFTAVPSRPFFPRGFLWDEGFHLLPILDWDAELVMQILSSWFNTMDEDGWIAREQILGPEARSKVPTEFQIQYPHYANPPTLYMVLEALLDKVNGKGDSKQQFQESIAGEVLVTPETVKAWLKNLYPLLQRNFEWYRRTQWGDLKSYDRSPFSSKEGYRWRGRTPQHILPSGLDDYPRAQPPHPGELHTDLLSWVGMMSRNLQRIADFLGETDDQVKYAKIENAIRKNVDDLHWSKEHKTYCDATIDDYEESTHVCHKGYISIFPFMCGLLSPDHKHLKDILDLIGDENELWSPHGIRSLSKSDDLYGTGENYWRSPVWLPLNYLIVKELLNVAQQPGPQQDQGRKLYVGLRKNLVDTVYKSWLETGFAWEQYNPETGAGQRTQHFTGWTSLVSKILAMPDLSGKRGHDEL